MRGPVLYLAAAFSLAAIAGAAAHGWYPWECCSDRDCEPLPEDAVEIRADGYHLPNGEIVKHGDERESGDGRFHWCRGLSEPRTLIRRDKACLFVPKGGA